MLQAAVGDGVSSMLSCCTDASWPDDRFRRVSPVARRCYLAVACRGLWAKDDASSDSWKEPLRKVAKQQGTGTSRPPATAGSAPGHSVSIAAWPGCKSAAKAAKRIAPRCTCSRLRKRQHLKEALFFIQQNSLLNREKFPVLREFRPASRRVTAQEFRTRTAIGRIGVSCIGTECRPAFSLQMQAEQRGFPAPI